MHRYLVGMLANKADEHIIVQEDGKRFAWCKPEAQVGRITGLAADQNHVSCPTCKGGSLMWLLEQKGGG